MPFCVLIHIYVTLYPRVALAAPLFWYAFVVSAQFCSAKVLILLGFVTDWSSIQQGKACNFSELQICDHKRKMDVRYTPFVITFKSHTPIFVITKVSPK